MTAWQEVQARVVQAAAEAAAGTAGVAFLRPGFADLVRGTATGTGTGTGAGAGTATGTRTGARAPGVRARYVHSPEGWHLQLHLAVLRGHQAVGVTRAVRTAVEAAVRHAAPGPGRDTALSVTVAVTVTDIT